MSQTSSGAPIIGREGELARLCDVLGRARGGEARAVLVAGDAGVGKTRVLDEVAGRAAAAGTLVAGIVLTDAAALRGDAEAAVERMRSTVTALTDDAGTPPDATVRLAALALSAVADRATELRLTGDEAGVRHWADTASELVEPARTTAVRGVDGTRQGPEGMAWLARAEAEWARAVSGPPSCA
nr:MULTISPECIES: AAA family ATPase [unclassified Streptomyces]